MIMKKMIHVLSRYDFEKFVRTLTDRQLAEIAIISVRDAEFPTILPDSENVLNLCFDDAEEQCGHVSTLFTEYMADQIMQHVQNNYEKNMWVVHCLLGQSRSGAIGDVLSEFFEIPCETFERMNSQVKPNTLVKNILRKKLGLTIF